ncbi:MAG: hypothetical protein JO146_09135 [Candidatus Eremiobacteraeota bacterium]|nr:hypothetical protein [Candidatus Eremiobacteraeota bacterium]
MNKVRLTAALAVALASAGTAVASAKLMPNVVNEPTRFGGSCCVYTGAPALAVTLSMVEAGGGPNNFSTVTLLKTLTGPLFSPEVAKLNKEYGEAQVAQFLKTFDFVVNDSLRIVTMKKIALPSQPNPDPKDGKALAAALWQAGQTGEGFNVEVMLDRAVSHPIHVQVMKDIDAKYGLAADAQYHAILTTAMKDLAGAYHLNASNM